VHGVGNAMLMRGGACAAELRLMGLVGGSLCVSGCVFVVWLCCVFCLLLFVGGCCCCVFLVLRLYFWMLVLCLSGVFVVGIVGVGGFMLWSLFCLCCVFLSFCVVLL
jgi:hypothetical protein